MDHRHFMIFEVFSRVLQETFCDKNFHDICVVHENYKVYDHRNLELFNIHISLTASELV